MNPIKFVPMIVIPSDMYVNQGLHTCTALFQKDFMIKASQAMRMVCFSHGGRIF